MPFLHTTIQIPNTYVNFTYPKVSEILRGYPRLWNYFNFIFGYAGLWLGFLLIIAWRRKNNDIFKLALLGIILNLGLFVFATISDGRFTLPLLVITNIFVLNEILQWIHKGVNSKSDSRK